MLVSGCGASASRPSGTIQGRATSFVKSPPPGHSSIFPDRGVVSAYTNSTRVGDPLVSTTTNSSGGYQLHIRPGTYYLAFTFSDHQADVVTGPMVVVSSGHSVTANIVDP
jgi:hypothetical protein